MRVRRLSPSESMARIAHEELWPRDLEHRYRVYAVSGSGRSPSERVVIAASATAGGVGEAIVALHEDMKLIGRRLADLGRIGVFDTLLGEWVVLPWDRRFD